MKRKTSQKTAKKNKPVFSISMLGIDTSKMSNTQKAKAIRDYIEKKGKGLDKNVKFHAVRRMHTYDYMGQAGASRPTTTVKLAEVKKPEPQVEIKKRETAIEAPVEFTHPETYADMPAVLIAEIFVNTQQIQKLSKKKNATAQIAAHNAVISTLNRLLSRSFKSRDGSALRLVK